MKPVLHPHQEQLAREVLRAFDSHKRVVLTSPTGSGKTITAASGILPHLPGPILWIAHRRELVQQAGEHLLAAGVEADVMTVQFFRPEGHYNTIVFDEGHHVCASVYQKLFDAFPHANHLALTATPYRLDGVGLGKCGFTSLVIGSDIFALTEQGFLTPATVLVPKDEEIGAWRVERAVKVIAHHCNTIHNALVYCPAVRDANQISRGLRSLGIEAIVVDSKTPNEERKNYAEDFKDGRIKVLCNHTIYTEGYDAPRVDCVVLNRATQSRCLWKQMIGRGLRTHPEKNGCLVLDLAGNTLIHGSIYDREVYDLHGEVESIEARGTPEPKDGELRVRYSNEHELKEWKPKITTLELRESLLRRRSISPLQRLLTA